MSVKMSTLVWQRSNQKGSGLLLMLAIADIANDDGYAEQISVLGFAKKTRMSDRQIKRLIKLIEKSGELVVFFGGGGRRGSGYYITLGMETETKLKLRKAASNHNQNNPYVRPIRGDKSGKRGDKMSPQEKERGDNLTCQVVKRGDKSGKRGDIAMSPSTLDIDKDHTTDKKNLSAVWKQASTELATEMLAQTYVNNFTKSRLVNLNGKTAVLEVRNLRAAEWINFRLSKQVNAAVSRAAGHEVAVTAVGAGGEASA